MDTISNETLEHLASEIGAFLSAWGPKAFELGPPELAESISLWMLGAAEIADAQAGLSQTAKKTGRWHHQLLFGGQALAFARSMPLGDGQDPASWRVLEAFESPMAGAINTALEWVVENIGGDPLVRLLVVPAYQVHALWLIVDGSAELYIVDCPQTFASMAVGTLMSEQEFLQALLVESPIVGIK